jgi:hypothetical protein
LKAAGLNVLGSWPYNFWRDVSVFVETILAL